MHKALLKNKKENNSEKMSTYSNRLAFYQTNDKFLN